MRLGIGKVLQHVAGPALLVVLLDAWVLGICGLGVLFSEKPKPDTEGWVLIISSKGVDSPTGYWGWHRGFQWGLRVMAAGMLLLWVGLIAQSPSVGESRRTKVAAGSGVAVIALCSLVAGWWVSRAVDRSLYGEEGLRAYDMEEAMRADPDRPFDEADFSQTDRVGSLVVRIWPKPDSRWSILASLGLVAVSGIGLVQLMRSRTPSS